MNNSPDPAETSPESESRDERALDTARSEDRPKHVEFGLLASFIYAFKGILRTLCTQRNMKIHWISGLAVMLVGMALPLELASRATMLLCVFMVIAMEVLNTALESFVDLHVKDFERNAMIAKDAAAAAVLILSAGAVIIFGDVLVHRWDMVTANPEAVWRTVYWGVPILICLAIMIFSPRNRVVLLLLMLTATVLLSYLAYHSRDEVFSLGALSFIGTAFISRWMEPQLVSEKAITIG